MNIQPTDTQEIVSVKYKDETIHSEKFIQPNFKKIIRATHTALDDVIARKLFTSQISSIDHFVDEYKSLDEWFEPHLKFTEDESILLQITERIKGVVSRLDGKYTIHQSYDEVTTLYQKMN